jgi:hypothetical protein
VARPGRVGYPESNSIELEARHADWAGAEFTAESSSHREPMIVSQAWLCPQSSRLACSRQIHAVGVGVRAYQPSSLSRLSSMPKWWPGG